MFATARARATGTPGVASARRSKSSSVTALSTALRCRSARACAPAIVSRGDAAAGGERLHDRQRRSEREQRRRAFHVLGGRGHGQRACRRRCCRPAHRRGGSRVTSRNPAGSISAAQSVAALDLAALRIQAIHALVRARPDPTRRLRASRPALRPHRSRAAMRCEPATIGCFAERKHRAGMPARDAECFWRPRSTRARRPRR